AIAAIELLDDGDRRRDAAAIAEAAITSNPGDPRLHEYAGMLALQLGEFERARQHYLFALAHDPRAYEWHVPIGLAATLHYSDSAHPDFVRFREGLEHGDLSELARAELHFSLGKASDDVGRFGDAAEHFRRGNAIRRRLTKWPRKAWRRAVGSRLASRPGSTAAPVADFTPVFIVGMPRTGTTLLAELLSRYPSVCNRGELTWLGRLAQRPELNGASDPETLQRAASTYASQSRQDDAAGERWFIDKQPLNFRYIDLALALFPDAKIIHCRRGARDTALSLWMQCFLEDEQSYAYDFGDIALVLRDEERLMTHWQAQYPASIRTLRYEELVAAPRNTVVALAEWIGLSPCSSREAGIPVIPESAISTASLWQARQPIHAHSVGRWQHYARYVPELLKLPGSRLDARFPGGNG
ncbi:MAG: sulfotransferase, partial [Rhodanobacteraceae bacterium]